MGSTGSMGDGDSDVHGHEDSSRDALLQGLWGLTLSLHALLADLPKGSAPAHKLRAILSAFDALLSEAEPAQSELDLRGGPRALALRLCQQAEASHGPGRPRLVLRLRGDGRGQAASPRAASFIADLLELWLQALPGQTGRGRLLIDLWWLEPALLLCASAPAERLAQADVRHWHERLGALGGHMRLERQGSSEPKRARLTLMLPAARAYRRR